MCQFVIGVYDKCDCYFVKGDPENVRLCGDRSVIESRNKRDYLFTKESERFIAYESWIVAISDLEDLITFYFEDEAYQEDEEDHESCIEFLKEVMKNRCPLHIDRFREIIRHRTDEKRITYTGLETRTLVKQPKKLKSVAKQSKKLESVSFNNIPEGWHEEVVKYHQQMEWPAPTDPAWPGKLQILKEERKKDLDNPNYRTIMTSLESKSNINK